MVNTVKQQINLFQPKRSSLIGLRSRYLFIAVLVVFNALLASWYFTTQQQVEVLQQRAQQITAAINQQHNADPVLTTPPEDADVTQQVKRLRDNLQAGEQILQTLQQQAEPPAFSGYLTALAQQTPEQVWLTKIDLHTVADTLSLNLHGMALDPELVPVFMTQLNTDPQFAALKFTSIELQRAPDSQVVRFHLATDTTRINQSIKD